MVEELFKMILKGIIIGVVVSAPMGPVGIFCIQRTLDKGRQSGFYTGVGAAVSDLIYCILTGFCLSFIEEFINVHRGPIQIFGASVLVGFGIWLVKKKPDSTSSPDAGQGSPSVEGDILKGFALTFSNPLILFLIIGLFAQFNFVVERMTFWHYVLGFIGIIAGALGWWWVVTYFVDKLRCHFNQRTMKLINTVVGVIILTFAVIGIVSATSANARRASFTPPMSADVTFRVADKSMKGWKCEMSDSEGVGFQVKVRPMSVADPFGDTRSEALEVAVEELSSGKELASAIVSEGIDPFKGANAWRLRRNGSLWNLYAGNRDYRHRLSFNKEMGMPGSPLLEGSGDIDVEIMSEESDSGFESIMVVEDINEIITSFKGKPAEISGIYSLFDYEHDDSYAKLGGEYRMVVIPQEDGCHDIVYLDGAKVYSDVWKPGMRKGRLRRSPFVNIYEVAWYDAKGVEMPSDIKADYDPLTQILTIRFPFQNSILRFKKEPGY